MSDHEVKPESNGFEVAETESWLLSLRVQCDVLHILSYKISKKVLTLLN